MPVISVIIPAHNAAPWIRASIGSVLTQTWRDLELIVVDDGSTDGTVELIEQLPDSRMRLVRQGNRGAAAARNRGLREAQGEFIQFLDADDLLGPGKLQSQMAALQLAPTDAVASCAWGKFTGDSSQVSVCPEPAWVVRNPLDWLVCSLSGGGMMHIGAWLIPRLVIERAGPWDESLSLHDDGEFFTRVLLQASCNVFVAAALVYYREVAGSLSRSTGCRAMHSALAVCRSRHHRLLAAADTGPVRRALATQYAQFAYEFCQQAPDLSQQALAAMRALGVCPAACIGGAGFRGLVRCLGFERAWKIRNWLRSHQNETDLGNRPNG